MNTVSFLVVFICLLITAILAGSALVQLHHHSARARATLVTSFGFGLAGIVLGAVLFGFFSI